MIELPVVRFEFSCSVLVVFCCLVLMRLLVEQLCFMVLLVASALVRFMDDCNTTYFLGTCVLEQLWSPGDWHVVVPDFGVPHCCHSVMFSW